MRKQRKWKKHLNIVSLGILLFMVWHIVQTVQFQLLKNKGAEACVLDSVVNMVWVKCSVILILFVVLEYIYSERKEYSIMQIVRSRGRTELFLKKCREIVMICIFWSILLIGISVVTGFFLTEGMWINWNDAGSYYQRQAAGQLVSVQTAAVLAAAGGLLFLQMNVMLNFSLIIAWFFDSYLFALLPIIAIALNDLHEEWIPIFFGRFTIIGTMWGNVDEHWVLRTVGLVFIDMVFIGLGRVLAEKKEFFGAKVIGK